MTDSAPPCSHRKLSLLPGIRKKLRCRHCHLTIDEEELENGFCPECYEVSGVRRRDFETVETHDDGVSRYACEQCGAIIEC